MSLTKLAPLALCAVLAACSPSEPAPTAAPEGAKQALPTDFLGVQLGSPLVAPPCLALDAEGPRPSPCTPPEGGTVVEQDRLPYGMEPAIYVLTDADGNADKVIATVEPGHDGSILANLAAKFGPPQVSQPNGERHWADETIGVMYKPATKYQEGLIAVATQTRLQRERREKEEAQNRKL